LLFHGCVLHGLVGAVTVLNQSINQCYTCSYEAQKNTVLIEHMHWAVSMTHLLATAAINQLRDGFSITARQVAA
jgi:hypothetical protein